MSIFYFCNYENIALDYKMGFLHFQLDQASLGLRREFLTKGLEDKIVSAYYNYMVDIARLFGADADRAKRELLESLQFEMELANVSRNRTKQRE